MSLSGYSVPETLTDDAGNALKSITVTVTGPSSYSGTATTDATTGVLRLGPLPVGDYTVTYRGRSVTVPVVAAAADIQTAFDLASAAETPTGAQAKATAAQTAAIAAAATDAASRVSAEATARDAAIAAQHSTDNATYAPISTTLTQAAAAAGYQPKFSRQHTVPFLAGSRKLMASPPTVVLTGGFATPVGNSDIASAVWKQTAAFGATWRAVGGVFSTFASNENLENGSPNDGTPCPYLIEFMHEGTAINIWRNDGTAGSYRLLVDDEYVSLDSTAFPGAGTFTRLSITFATRDIRKISIETQRSSIQSVHMGPNDAMWQTPPPSDLVAFLTDSYGLAGGATNKIDGWTFHAARRARIQQPWVFAQGGRGYLNPGVTTGAYMGTFATSLAGIAASCIADSLVVQGGINDVPSVNAAYTASALQAAATALFAAIATTLPSVKRLYVVGCAQPSGSPAAELTNANNAIKAAALAASNVTAFIDTTNFFSGTGDIGSPTGSGTCDFCVYSDRTHLTTEGYKVFGNRVGSGVINALSTV